ncbi:sigma-E factor negative regulatory protein [Halioxenophilus sp. WMMB6]|uniref:sigma-E factor negative regulatory protein n=1 Tax=Halioxenophilus sp. WMMB6 TaxID=3073815 RepID=UPI00295E26F1|nr:sigma-E factor negative regulatory protein [Halioxenophilus sp. WMMB6]
MAEQVGISPFDESLRQSLSAMVDGEASELELRRILAESENNSELRKTWARYQIASRSIRREEAGFFQVDLSASISELIAEEPNHNGLAVDAGRRRFGGVAGHLGRVAIAASVAVVAVFAVNQISPESEAPAATVAANTGGVAVEDQVFAPAANLPMGYGTPGLSVRNVSTDGIVLDQRRSAVPVVFEPRSDVQAANPAVEEFLRQLMAEHANSGLEIEGAMPFERVPRIEPAQE